MTIPNNFQINSDYLSFGLKSSSDHQLSVPAGQLVNGGGEWSTTIKVDAQVGAIDTYQVTFNGETLVGSTFYINPSSIATEVDVFRSAPDTITVGIRYYGMLDGNTDGKWSAYNLALHVDSFAPPQLT